MIAVESKIILSFFAEKGPYNMTVRSVVPLIVTDTKAYMKYLGHMKRIYAYLRFFRTPCMRGGIASQWSKGITMVD